MFHFDFVLGSIFVDNYQAFTLVEHNLCDFVEHMRCGSASIFKVS